MDEKTKNTLSAGDDEDSTLLQKSDGGSGNDAKMMSEGKGAVVVAMMLVCWCGLLVVFE